MTKAEREMLSAIGETLRLLLTQATSGGAIPINRADYCHARLSRASADMKLEGDPQQ